MSASASICLRRLHERRCAPWACSVDGCVGCRSGLHVDTDERQLLVCRRLRWFEGDVGALDGRAAREDLDEELHCLTADVPTRRKREVESLDSTRAGMLRGGDGF